MIHYDVDVLVIGGGPGGFAAAISAARRGLRTLLIENMTSLGGLMTNGFVTGPAGMIEGLCKELLDRLDKKGYLYNTPHTPAVDPERCNRLIFQRIHGISASFIDSRMFTTVFFRTNRR